MPMVIIGAKKPADDEGGGSMLGDDGDNEPMDAKAMAAKMVLKAIERGNSAKLARAMEAFVNACKGYDEDEE